MSNCSTSKRKVIEHDEDGQLPKRRRSVEGDHSDGQIEFTDINTDCLEKIFQCLELGDLLNVADTCKHFKEATDIVVSRKFAKKWILIDKIRASRTRLINVRNNFVELNDLKSIVQTLRLFGHLIKKLHLRGGDVPKKFPEQTIDFLAKSVGLLSFYIGNYCVVSLTELTIEKRIAFKLFRKPFLNVEKVKINTNCQLDRNWFIKIFPNISQLKWAIGRTNNFNCMDRLPYLDKLQHLDLSYAVHIHCRNLHRINILGECIDANIMSLNSHLITLALPYISDIKTLKIISEQQQQLEYLSFQYAPKDELNFETIHFQTVKKLKICLCSPNYRPNLEPIVFGAVGNEMTKIPFSFDKLEELIIQTCFQYSDEFYNFIRKHKSITKLNLRSCGWPQFTLTDLNRMKLLGALPLLNKIDLPCHILKVDEAIAYVNEFKELKRFSFKLHVWDNKNAFKNLVNRFKNEWQTNLCSHGSFVTMKRIVPK